MSFTLEAVMEPYNLGIIVFGILLVSAQVVEIYFTFIPLLQWVSKSLLLLISSQADDIAVLKRARTVVHDFRCRRFYKPWGRREPVIIRNLENIEELSEHPALSQRAVYSDIFGFKHTLTNTRTYDPNDETKARDRLFSRVIRVIGVSQISDLQLILQKKLEQKSIEEIDSQSMVDGWTSVRLASLMRNLAYAMLGVYFFGENLSQEPEFSSALVRYYKDVMAFMGALQFIPKFMAPFIYAVITNRGRALGILFKRLRLAMDSNQQGWDEDESIKKMTLFYNMVESSKESDYWNDNLVIQAVIGIWFAAAHQPWINLHFAFLELCARPEYIQELRNEIGGQGTLDYKKISNLPILDSFIKEVVRLNPLDKMAIRRKALRPFTFSKGGPHVALGEIVCVSAWDIMHNEQKYEPAHLFDGHRFVDNSLLTPKRVRQQDSNVRGTTFTDVSQDFPIWGYGSKACPGRWHASLVIKMVIIHLVMNYEFRLQDEKASHEWFWESFKMPYESTQLLFRKRVSK